MKFRTVSEALPELCTELLSAPEALSRNGATRELLMQHIVLTHPLEREVVNSARKASLPAQIAESAWVLAGRNDVEWLSHYLPRAKEFSDDGKVWRGGYGPRIRKWSYENENVSWTVDQLRHVVDLLKADPATRRAVISIYDPAVDTAPGKDIPCNNWLSFVARDGALHLHVATRSNDLIWGWSGINAFEWSVLLEVVAGLTDLRVGSVHFSITSLHLYEHHYAKAEALARDKSAKERSWQPSPRFAAKSVAELDKYLAKFFRLEEALRTRPGDGYFKEIEAFPEPMLRSWLQVLAWWWSGSETYLDPLLGTAMYWAALKSPLRPKPVVQLQNKMSIAIAELHQRKDKAYGDSWKRRGEQVAIQANIARKVDRLGAAGDQDETALDTAIDLLVYLLKYEAWLDEQAGVFDMPRTEDERVRRGLARLEKNGNAAITTPDADYCQNLDNSLNDMLQPWQGHNDKVAIVRGMILDAWDLCSLRWAASHSKTDADEKLLRARDERIMREQLWKQGNETRSWNPEQ